MKSIRSIVAAFALAASGAVLAAPAPVLSNFSLDSEDWKTVDLLGLPGLNTVIRDPTGFIASYDNNTWNAFSAPAKFLGDKRGFLGGTLSLKLSDSMSDDLPGWPVVFITDGAIKLASWPFAKPGSNFTNFSFALNAGSWVNAGLSHSSASEFATVLGGLTGLFVNADFKTSGNDYARLDDVMLTAAVPEPETYALFLAGLGVLGITLGRRRRGA